MLVYSLSAQPGRRGVWYGDEVELEEETEKGEDVIIAEFSEGISIPYQHCAILLLTITMDHDLRPQCLARLESLVRMYLPRRNSTSMKTQIRIMQGLYLIRNEVATSLL
jgi:hypothetical protein